jgi:hypothetical protein
MNDSTQLHLAYTVGDCVCCGALYYGPVGTMHPFCDSMLFRPVSTVQEARSGGDSRTGLRSRRTAANAEDAMRWGCGDSLTGHQMRAHFTRCPNRPIELPKVNYLDRRRRNWKVKPRRPPGLRMLCGWRCDARLTARGIRAHFNNCTRRQWVRGLGGRFSSSRKSARRGPITDQQGGLCLGTHPSPQNSAANLLQSPDHVLQASS